MLKDFAWKVFESTGNIDNYMFYREIQERNLSFREQKEAEEEVAISN